MKYKIGQVLYVLLNRETKICPVQVVEEITKRTLSGETINYIVKVGKKGETTSLSDMDGQVFDSVDSLRTTLYDRITRSVETIITNTVVRANEWYPTQQQVEETIQIQELAQPEIVTFTEETIGDEETMVTLPDGTVAKLKMPFPGT